MSDGASDLAAMTVNERLGVCGLFAEFDKALAEWDEGALRRIFVQIELPDYPIEKLRKR